MKIVDGRRREAVAFTKVKTGECFMLKDGLYMKLAADEDYEEGDVVVLGSGRVVHIGPDRAVIPVKTKVVIGGE